MLVRLHVSHEICVSLRSMELRLGEIARERHGHKLRWNTCKQALLWPRFSARRCILPLRLGDEIVVSMWRRMIQNKTLITILAGWNKDEIIEVGQILPSSLLNWLFYSVSISLSWGKEHLEIYVMIGVWDSLKNWLVNLRHITIQTSENLGNTTEFSQSNDEWICFDQVNNILSWRYFIWSAYFFYIFRISFGWS